MSLTHRNTPDLYIIDEMLNDDEDLDRFYNILNGFKETLT